MSVNKVILIGNATQPEIKTVGGAKLASFRIATTERFKDRGGENRENTEWHTISAWRTAADIVEKYVAKGSQVYIEGKLHTREWQDQTGAKRYTTEIVVDSIQLLGKRTDNGGGRRQENDTDF